jgi:hypothetical protein
MFCEFGHDRVQMHPVMQANINFYKCPSCGEEVSGSDREKRIASFLERCAIIRMSNRQLRVTANP